MGEGLRLTERSDAPAERVRVGCSPIIAQQSALTLSRKTDRLTALGRLSPLPLGEKKSHSAAALASLAVASWASHCSILRAVYSGERVKRASTP